MISENTERLRLAGVAKISELFKTNNREDIYLTRNRKLDFCKSIDDRGKMQNCTFLTSFYLF